MSNPIVSTFKGVLASVVLLANIATVFSLLFPLALIKVVLPFTAVRKVIDSVLNALAEWWIAVNTAWMKAVNGNPWEVTGLEGFKLRGWYLVNANHQSWVDILVLQRVFNRRIPLLKFFLKRELLYVPIMGLAWWALDFPFMRRKGGKTAAKDIETARKSCEKFRVIPTSVISFAEGTRYTRAKHDQQKSPYKTLLKPKTGGLGMALETIGPKFDALVDVTIDYPDGVPTFWDLLTGRVSRVRVDVRQVQIPAVLSNVDDASVGAYRSQLQAWVNEQWQRKDALLLQWRQGRA
jgi:1-acyl-sn-glycerol-3-phosphate acyltransferase